MFNNINKLPTKKIESKLFKELQKVYQDILLLILTDFYRFKNREKQETTITTMFGLITVNRRRYMDGIADERIA